MQDNQLSLPNQLILEHLEDLWQDTQEPTPAVLRQIIEFVVGIQEPYRTIGLQKIAEHTINSTNLHILALMATFQQKAEQEGISRKDCDESSDHIYPEAFRILDELGKNVSIRSLDDLVALSNITLGLQTLSQTDSAEEARIWLYELPTIYYRQLMQESLVVDSQSQQSINWFQFGAIPGTATVVLETGSTELTLSSEKNLSSSVPIVLERSAA